VRDTYEIKRSNLAKFVSGAVNLSSLYSGAILSAAQAIRDARTKTLYAPELGVPIRDNSVGWLVSPNYKLTNHVLLYASVSHGEKSGAVQFDDDTGAIRNVRPEKVMDYELGVKSTLLGGKGTLNVNLYDTEVSDYQAQLSIQSGPDILSYLGNVGKVRMRGVELESSWQVVRSLTLSLSGAYNDAIYKQFDDAPCAVELTNVQQVCNLTGRQLQGASKWTINGGFDYMQPVGGHLQVYVDAAAAYRSSANLNSSLSIYGIQPAYTLVNGAIGLRHGDGRWDVSLWVKNLLDEKYFTDNGAASSTGAFTFTEGDRRSFGVALRTRI
jgi:iron complex outermembrane recepter protein